MILGFIIIIIIVTITTLPLQQPRIASTYVPTARSASSTTIILTTTAATTVTAATATNPAANAPKLTARRGLLVPKRFSRPLCCRFGLDLGTDSAADTWCVNCILPTVYTVPAMTLPAFSVRVRRWD
jgi:hypothetical protein